MQQGSTLNSLITIGLDLGDRFSHACVLAATLHRSNETAQPECEWKPGGKTSNRPQRTFSSTNTGPIVEVVKLGWVLRRRSTHRRFMNNPG